MMGGRGCTLLSAVLLVGVAAPAPAAKRKGKSDAAGADISKYYTIENVASPKGLDPQYGGLDFMPDGRLVACFHRGEIYTYQPKTKKWKLFADGLHEPLGLVAVSDTEVVVMQRPELTRVKDTDGDGVADHYETLSDAFGMTGNYHEFAFGPARDKDGNFFVSLNVASNGAPVRPEVRGRWTDIGLPRKAFYGDWRRVKGAAGRMYSRVPYRGWVLKVAPDGTTTPIASGFRSPNGLGFDKDGRLFVSDNQGDWLGSSKLFHVEQGKFYGHIASLVWREDWDERDPLSVPVAEIDKMRTRASIVFPQGLMANSPTQPFTDTTGGKFGPFAGQLFIGEMNRSRIIRLLVDEVDGQVQGACVPFYDGAGLTRGNNRFAFDKDGALWVGHTHLSWAGGQGLQKIAWSGRTPLDVLAMKLTKTGFDLTFTKPIDPATASAPAAWPMRRFFYRYHRSYGGSPQYDKPGVKVTKIQVSTDRRTVSLTLDTLVPWRLYEFRITGVKAADGEAVAHPLLIYTLNRLVENTPPPGPETFAGSAPQKVSKVRGANIPARGKGYDVAKALYRGASTGSSNGGFTGAGYLDFQNDKGAYIEWTVKAKAAGPHELHFRYALAGGARPLEVKVNGKVVAASAPFKATGSWSTWKHETVRADLQAGRNTVRLTAIGHSGGNFDRLEVEPIK